MLSKILKSLILLFVFFSPEIEAKEKNPISTNEAFNVVISKPIFNFTFLCQSSSINTNHTLTFSVTPVGNLQSNNVFTLEMSDDDFSSNIVQLSATTTNGSSPSEFVMNFTLPNTTYGAGYKLRVKSSAPAATSVRSNPFDAYFMIHNQGIKLNSATGIDSEVAYCAGSSFNLFIFDSGDASSPLFYPNLTYTWKKKVGSSDVVVGTGTSLSVNSPGQYFVETNYGVCTPSSLSKSILVTVTESSANSIIISTATNTNEVCESVGELLTLNISNSSIYTIKWFLDDDLIDGATSNTYNAVSGGTYKATVDNGSCVTTSNTYTLTSDTFSATIDVNSPYQLSLGESFLVTVTTDANAPSFQWYFNDNLLSETSNVLNISQTGEFKVLVTQTTGCVSTKELTLIVIEPSVDEIPNLISPNGDGFNDKFKVPFELTSSNNLNLEIYTSSGKQIFITDNYQNNWPENTEEIFQSKSFFYFKLTKENQLIKEGILTIIK